MSLQERNERRVQRLLVVGFLLIILLLFADGFVGFRSIFAIRAAASRLVGDQFLQMSLVDEVQREQDAMNAVFYILAGDPDSLDQGQILSQINGIEEDLHRIVSTAPVDNSERHVWNQLASSSAAFSAEARRLLQLSNASTLASHELLRRHEEVVATVARLIRLSHQKARRAKEEIESLAESQFRKDAFLLGGCLALACLCAFLVVRSAAALYRRMTEQSEELSRVSWQLLDNQEMIARRLSHELHDELGQSLTALKTNFSRHASVPCVDPAWMQDCSQLLKESIRSAHEISQLLRPTILDDFGLDSALNWLCERFMERNGIEVEYSSDFQGRLPAETETHLFRIAQEALTNVSRHAGASLVTVRLRQRGEAICLAIQDNGKGLPLGQVRHGAVGMTGMQARARTSQGELTIRSEPGRGVSIELWIPLETKRDEEKDPHLIG